MRNVHAKRVVDPTTEPTGEPTLPFLQHHRPLFAAIAVSAPLPLLFTHSDNLSDRILSLLIFGGVPGAILWLGYKASTGTIDAAARDRFIRGGTMIGLALAATIGVLFALPFRLQLSATSSEMFGGPEILELIAAIATMGIVYPRLFWRLAVPKAPPRYF